MPIQDHHLLPPNVNKEVSKGQGSRISLGLEKQCVCRRFSATWDQPRIKSAKSQRLHRKALSISGESLPIVPTNPHLNRLAPKQNPSRDPKVRDPNNPIRVLTHHYSSQKALRDRACSKDVSWIKARESKSGSRRVYPGRRFSRHQDRERQSASS
ncbi:hypothetical protein Nepgr_031749 [Nepenthes gracilis]|uniref:Uncharacterized protein n=1 Tax=Nepenthes gracilis TaxID=150966 RepID=A0AAD3TIQ6_NEPGR|nr:hypothetical protein Nepgr_031749 [Nepenthes gracilis]